MASCMGREMRGQEEDSCSTARNTLCSWPMEEQVGFSFTPKEDKKPEQVSRHGGEREGVQEDDNGKGDQNIY